MKAQGSLASVSPVTQSAVSILPPVELWDAIQEIRAQYDKSYTRWDPHVNLLWPFLPSGYFPQAMELVQNNAQFKKISPFRVRLETFAFTPGSKYLHLNVQVIGGPAPPAQKSGAKKKAQPLPETPLELLHKALAGIFPSCGGDATSPSPSAPAKGKPAPKKAEPSISFSAHMTVAQLPQDELPTLCAEFQRTWQPIEFDVTEICFLSRKSDSEKMKVLGTIKLGQN